MTKKIRENPAFCFEQLSGAGNILLSNSTIFPLSLIYRCSLSLLCFVSLLLFMFVFRYASANWRSAGSYDPGLCRLKGSPG